MADCTTLAEFLELLETQPRRARAHARICPPCRGMLDLAALGAQAIVATQESQQPSEQPDRTRAGNRDHLLSKSGPGSES